MNMVSELVLTRNQLLEIDGQLLVILDVERVLDMGHEAMAA